MLMGSRMTIFIMSRPEDEPVLEVAGRGLDALPLAPREGYGALLIQAAQLALAVYEAVPLLGRAEGHKVVGPPPVMRSLSIFSLFSCFFCDVVPVDLGDHFLPDLEVARGRFS